jgi:hypothetical protein
MILCQKVIPTIVDEHGRMLSNTYCMEPIGHAGKCKPEVKPSVACTRHDFQDGKCIGCGELEDASPSRS